jgi:hypothetical protein
MTEYELQDIIFSSISEARAFFDFWLTVTCTALAVGYYALADIEQKYRSYVIVLYTIVAIVILARWFDASIMIASFNVELRELGVKPKMTVFTQAIWLLQTVFMLVGTVLTIAFLRSRRGSE